MVILDQLPKIYFDGCFQVHHGHPSNTQFHTGARYEIDWQISIDVDTVTKMGFSIFCTKLHVSRAWRYIIKTDPFANKYCYGSDKTQTIIKTYAGRTIFIFFLPVGWNNICLLGLATFGDWASFAPFLMFFRNLPVLSSPKEVQIRRLVQRSF